MKSFSFKLISLILALLATLPAGAYDFMADGLCYDINADETSVSVTSENASGGYSNLSGNRVISPTVQYGGKTYTVTAIADRAFRGCGELTGVTLPGTITSIGYGAFWGCSGMTGMTIPNSVASIGDGVFNNCTDLASIIVESGNPVYDSRGNCNAVIETATNTLRAGCKNSTIPSSITAIGSEAFSSCIGLTSVTIPNSVTTIGVGAFSNCSSLTGITLPGSVSSLGDFAFGGCSGLESISVESGNSNYDSRNNCNAIIETASNTLIQGCNNSVIPSSVTKIGRNAFYNCEGLTSVTLPNSLTEIGNYAFMGCSGLTKITFGRELSSIGYAAFDGCSGLTGINIPASVTSIGTAPFRDSGLVSITVESGNKYYDSRDNCNAIIETASNTLIQGCNSSFIPASVKTIGFLAFWGFQNLTELTFPQSLEFIDSQAFTNCTGLRKITALGVIPAKLGYNVWEGVDLSKVELNVLPECVSIYKFFNQWKNFKVVATNGQGSTSKILCAFFTNPYWWDPVNCYTWNKDLGNKTYSGTWPGTKCDRVEASEYGVTWMWYGGYVGEDVPTGIIFNNNVGNQTADFPFVNGGVYDMNGFIRSIYNEPGDVNGDEVVSGADVTALYNVLLNGAEAAGNGDVNGDGVVSGADVTALYNLLLQ